MTPLSSTAATLELPRLTQARVDLLRTITVVDESGNSRQLTIPMERALTLFVDKRELVTLMTLGQYPEWLALGYLLNQGLVDGVGQVESVTVDWSVEAAAVKTRAGGGLGVAALEKTEHRVVTTGCGQGTAFGDLLADVTGLAISADRGARLEQSALYRILEIMRRQDCIHRQAGSVHGCAVFSGEEMLFFVEDVGRHNALDTIAGWMAMNGVDGADKVFYTTGRLTSEMVLKAARMGVAVVISRNGVTAMGHQLATQLGLTLIGRALNRHYLCYCGAQRLVVPPPLDA